MPSRQLLEYLTKDSGSGGSSRWGCRVEALKLGGYLRGGELESRVSRLLQEYPTLRVLPGASVDSVEVFY